MITFTIEASNFIAAGEIEKALKAAKIRFTTEISNGHKKARKGYTRVTPELVKDILGYLATHSSETNAAVAAHFETGANTIWRIRNGTHNLCKKV
jgi:hypothetical protein